MLSSMEKRSLRGLTYSMLKSMNKIFYIMFFVLAVVTVLNIINTAVTLSKNEIQFISTSSGTLTVGFITCLITLSITSFIITSGAELSRNFMWPVSRKIYAIGNFITMLASSTVFISSVTLLFGLEIIGIRLVKIFAPGVSILNFVSLEGYFVGYWTSITYVLLISSFAYCLGMYFFRDKVRVGVLVAVLALMGINTTFGDLYIKVASWIFEENSIALFSLKAWVVIILFHLLPYIPLRRMEVRS